MKRSSIGCKCQLELPSSHILLQQDTVLCYSGSCAQQHSNRALYFVFSVLLLLPLKNVNDNFLSLILSQSKAHWSFFAIDLCFTFSCTERASPVLFLDLPVTGHVRSDTHPIARPASLWPHALCQLGLGRNCSWYYPTLNTTRLSDFSNSSLWGRAKPPMPQQPHRGISTKFPWKQFHVQLRHFKPIWAQNLAWPYTFENVDDEIVCWKVLPFPDILGICTVLDKSGCYRSSSMNLMLYSTKSAPSSFEIGLSKSIFEMYFLHDNKLTSKLIYFKKYSLKFLEALF